MKIDAVQYHLVTEYDPDRTRMINNLVMRSGEQ
jgi:hypothetical protein